MYNKYHMKKVINWALVGTKGTVNHFLAGLRAAGGHAMAVVSRAQDRAHHFAGRNGIEKAFGNFDQMLEDPEIDVVYIGTPHITHKDLTIRALKAKKAVLCEKPMAINAWETREMIEAAGENNTFLMEAMWTRFRPAMYKVRNWLSKGLIGKVKMVQANFGFRAPIEPDHRLFKLELGGGALLDVGIYPISFASMVFGGQKPHDIKSHIVIGKTGVDEEAAAIISYGGSRLACASTAIRTKMVNDAWIYGDSGKIYIPSFVQALGAELLQDGKKKSRFDQEDVSNGFNFEAAEVMDCIRKGLSESPIMPLDESLVVMETMDAIRAQNNFWYPSETRPG